MQFGVLSQGQAASPGLEGEMNKYCPIEAAQKHAGNLPAPRTILAVAKSRRVPSESCSPGSCCQPAPSGWVLSTFPLALSQFPEPAPEGPSPKATFSCSDCLLSSRTEACSLSLLSSSKVLDKTAVHVKMLAATPTTPLFS